MKPPFPGELALCRNTWGIPFRFVVDAYEIATQFVIGVNFGGGYVRVPLAKCVKDQYSREGVDMVPR